MRSFRAPRSAWLLLGLAAAIAAACGGSGVGSSGVFPGGDDGGGVQPIDDGGQLGLLGDGGEAGHTHATALVFDPPAQTLTVDGVTPASATYTLRATLDDGTVVPVAPESLELDRPDLAAVHAGNPVTLTAPGEYAGTGTLHAVYGGASATATLTVVVHKQSLGGVSPTVAGALDGATAADPKLSSLLYPYDQTVWPLGLTSPLVMWALPGASDTYRLRLEQSNYRYDAYATVSTIGQLRVDQATWDRMTASNPGGAGDPVKMTLSRWDGTNAYVSAKIALPIAPASLRGAIYYWTASMDAQGVRRGHISRFRPGSGATPEPLNNGRCMGCHAVSADGTTLVADVDDQDQSTPDAGNRVPSIAPYGNWSNTRAWASFDVTKPAAPLTLQTTKFGADIALSPDGKLVVFGGESSPTQPGSKNVSLADTKTGTVFAGSGLDAVNLAQGTNLMMPAFAPDGTKVAFVQGGGDLHDNVIPASPESIGWLDFDATGPRFDPTFHTLVDGANAAFGARTGLAYPSFTPDGKALAFHAGTHSTGCNASCDDLEYDDGDLWIQPLGAAAPIKLTRATDPPSDTGKGVSVEPTFNPVARGGYSWVVFTSFRDWGNALTGTSSASGQRQNAMRRLWVAAVDTTVGTVDPSHPAIYLEGQEATPNMRGFWSLASCTASAPAGGGADAGTGASVCGAGFECCSGFCEKGVCTDVSQVACAGVGGKCTSTGDCCNAGPVTCQSGVCAPVPVK